MKGKILSVTDHLKKYIKKADECAEKEKFLSALGFCFSALSIKRTSETLSAIANVYADMGLYELSNKYWFYYLEKTPEKSCGRAYEELAINYFYLSNFTMSGYYFNKKIETDGFLSPEGIDKEITEYFSAPIEEKGFRLVYPLSKAEIESRVKDAKRKMAGADFEGAIKAYLEIPETANGYDKIADDLSLAYFLSGNVEKGIEINRKRLKSGGDKFSAYCNLSSMYGSKKDKEKSEYYYALALSEPIKNSEDEYRLATVCLEHNNEQKGLALLEKVLKERAFDVDTEYLLALVNVNLYRYDEAERILKNLVMIDPTDFLYGYYLRLVKMLKKGDEKALSYLPVEYELDIPRKVRTEWFDKFRDSLGVLTPAREKAMLEILDWGIRDFSGNEIFAKSCVLFFMTGKRRGEKFLREKLLDPDIAPEIKVLIIYVLIINGCFEKISFVVSGVFMKVKPTNIGVGEDFTANRFKSAYALCFAKSVVMGISDVNKIAKSAEKIAKQARQNFVSADEGEWATLILDGCKYPYFKNLRDLCSTFGTDEIKISELKRKLKGENNDKSY